MDKPSLPNNSLGANNQPIRKTIPNGVVSAGKADDPYVYASMLSTFLGTTGPFSNMVAEFSKAVHMMTDTRKLTQQRISQIEAQTAKVQGQITASQSKTTGIQLDKLR
jgi:hypothetical protein